MRTGIGFGWALIGLVAMLATACSGDGQGEPQSLGGFWLWASSVDDPVHLEALAADLGWTVDEVRYQLTKQAVLDQVVESIETMHPAGSLLRWAGPAPSSDATILLVGEASQAVTKLVDESEIRIRLVDHYQSFDVAPLLDPVLQPVWDAGHVVSVSEGPGLVLVSVQSLSTSPVSIEEIVELIPAEHRDRVAVEVSVIDVSGREWGPLAVNAIPGNGGSGFERARLRISERCVTVEADGDEWLVVWPHFNTSWDSEKVAVVRQLDYPEDSATSITRSVTLRDGDLVTIFGGLVTDYREIRELWVAPPDPSCPTQALIAVADPPEVLAGD